MVNGFYPSSSLSHKRQRNLELWLDYHSKLCSSKWASPGPEMATATAPGTSQLWYCFSWSSSRFVCCSPLRGTKREREMSKSRVVASTGSLLSTLILLLKIDLNYVLGAWGTQFGRCYLSISQSNDSTLSILLSVFAIFQIITEQRRERRGQKRADRNGFHFLLYLSSWASNFLPLSLSQKLSHCLKPKENQQLMVNAVVVAKIMIAILIM